MKNSVDFWEAGLGLKKIWDGGRGLRGISLGFGCGIFLFLVEIENAGERAYTYIWYFTSTQTFRNALTVSVVQHKIESNTKTRTLVLFCVTKRLGRRNTKKYLVLKRRARALLPNSSYWDKLQSNRAGWGIRIFLENSCFFFSSLSTCSLSFWYIVWYEYIIHHPK